MAKILQNKAEFEAAIQGNAIVDFYADWCGPCRMLGPTIEKLATKYEGKITIVKLNVDQISEVAATYGVDTIPTVIFFKNGKQLGRTIGFQGEGVFEQAIKENF